MSPAEPILGPVFIGLFIEFLLLGIVISQIFLYHTTCKRDHIWIKLYVGLLFTTSIASAVLSLISVYSTLVTHFEDSLALQVANWASIASPTPQAFVAFLVQLFFGWRINILFSNLWLMVAVLIAALCQFMAGIGTTIAMHKIPEYARFNEFQPVVIVWVVSTAVVDTVIAGSLVFYVVKKMSYKATVGSQFYVVILPTGFITAVIAIAQLTTFFSSTRSVCLLFGIFLPNLYVISLMSSLNSREGWKYTREQLDDHEVAEKPRPRTVYTYNPDIIPLGSLRSVFAKDIEVEDREDKDITGSTAASPSHISIPSLDFRG